MAEVGWPAIDGVGHPHRPPRGSRRGPGAPAPPPPGTRLHRDTCRSPAPPPTRCQTPGPASRGTSPSIEHCIAFFLERAPPTHIRATRPPCAAATSMSRSRRSSLDAWINAHGLVVTAAITISRVALQLLRRGLERAAILLHRRQHDRTVGPQLLRRVCQRPAEPSAPQPAGEEAGSSAAAPSRTRAPMAVVVHRRQRDAEVSRRGCLVANRSAESVPHSVPLCSTAASTTPRSPRIASEANSSALPSCVTAARATSRSPRSFADASSSSRPTSVTAESTSGLAPLFTS